MNTNDRQPLLLAAAFIVGLLIGWFLFGYQFFPIEFTDAAPRNLHPTDKDNYILTTAELYAFDGNAAKVQQRMLSAWPQAEAAFDTCDLWQRTPDPTTKQQLEAIALIAGGQTCANILAAGPAEEEGAGLDFGPLLALLIVLVLLLAAIYFVTQRRNALMSEVEDLTIGGAMPEAPPATIGDEDVSAIPLARFQSSYTIGRDNYDDSFSIENSSGDFLGECGVGISESIGTDMPKNVTAFEVWLFDKNDIRTVTKVIMSDHAFFDEALKAKLAPKGEPVLARENEVVVLETASLIVNAEIKSMNYGSGTLPPQSFFDNFTVELSAWAKDGDTPEADVEGRVDELLDY